jgi:hypothetical protein
MCKTYRKERDLYEGQKTKKAPYKRQKYKYCEYERNQNL